MKDLLNSHQKNSLKVALLTLEESLRQALEWLDGREENGILYRRKLTLSRENRRLSIQSIRTALERIEKLSREFGLEQEIQNAASLLQGELTVNWANLMDTQSSKLKRYGKVHPDLAGALDNDIQLPARIALQLSGILGGSQQEESK